ncbi:hypothetical protein [Paenibacillus beijingensis]|uniref:DUF2157 domain-containing protein n=1 Tax=Paenibacillus beijingensis TaxID=1126833 RepID=A0A0D5NS79_9BACL|nr:hypothetical protein [Paenibacillus beijingensis]AJY77857.1 hypothetical protein VN24_19410 [Paenibacillus beijingensis]
MDGDRRKTIVKEIDHWQRSRLLPDQYCEFLRNLYLEAAEERTPASLTGKAVRAAGGASGKQWLLTFGLFSFICFIALHFNVFHPALQIAIVASGSAVLLLFGQRTRRRSETSGLIWIGLGMLLLIGGGLYMLRLHGIESWVPKAVLLAGCALLWIVFGLAARIPLLHLCGWIAAVLLYALVLHRRDVTLRIYEIELIWLPCAGVFGWLGWFIHRWSKQAAAVLLATALLLFFMPELYIAAFIDDWIWLQVQFIGKIAFGGVLLFALRKHWIAWVA